MNALSRGFNNAKRRIYVACQRYNFPFKSGMPSAYPISVRYCGSSSVTDRFSDIPGVKSDGDKFVLMFTCKVCETRSAKYISKNSYNKGCVVVRCPGCRNLHLISDHLGIFEDPGWDIEKYLSAGGEAVNAFNDSNILELKLEDVLAIKSIVPSDKSRN